MVFSIFDGIKEQVNAAGGTVTLSVSGHYLDKPDVAIVVFGEDPMQNSKVIGLIWIFSLRMV